MDGNLVQFLIVHMKDSITDFLKQIDPAKKYGERELLEAFITFQKQDFDRLRTDKKSVREFKLIRRQ